MSISEITRQLIRWHIYVGVPLAALFHSLLQFAYDPPIRWQEWWIFPVHFGMGVLVGSIILIPVYSIQAVFVAFFIRHAIPGVAILILGGCYQAIIVLVWSFTVGIQPSLGGRFPLAPAMIIAAFIAGCIVAGIALKKV